jgi:hypothetical protein
MAVQQLQQTKSCPFCTEQIAASAIKCRFCGEFLNTPQAKELQNQISTGMPKEEAIFKGKPSLFGLAGSFFKAGLCFIAALFIMFYPFENNLTSFDISQTAAHKIAVFRICSGLTAIFIIAFILFIKILRLYSVHYEISDDRIEYGRGLFDKKVDNLDMFRIIDLSMKRSATDLIFGIGDVELVTTDKTHPKFVFKHMRKPRQIYDIIKKSSLRADKDRTVVHLE